MTKDRILIISGGILPVPAVNGGAVETLIDSLIRENSIHKEFCIDVVSCDGGTDTENTDAAYIKIRYPWYVRWMDRMAYLYMEKKKSWRSMFARNHYKSIYYRKRLKKAVDYERYGAVIVENNMTLLEAVCEEMGESFSDKCYYHMHSVLIDNPAMVPYLAKCRKILTVSDYVTRELKKKVPEFEHTVIEKVTNGIRLPAEEGEDTAGSLRKFYGIHKDACVFLYMGRLSVEKGARELLDAYEQGNFKNAVLVYAGSAISGSAEMTSYVKEMMQRAEQSDGRVIFTGYIPHEDVGGYYRMADALVVPSVVGDAAPPTILEGMAPGIPIIAARVGGIPEYTEHYSAISYVEPGKGFTERLSIRMADFAQSCTHTRVTPVYYDTCQFFKSFCNAVRDGEDSYE